MIVESNKAILCSNLQSVERTYNNNTYILNNDDISKIQNHVPFSIYCIINNYPIITYFLDFLIYLHKQYVMELQ